MQYHKASPTADRARWRWYEILSYFGIPEQALRMKKHGPCPLCGGKDRYRWTDKDDNGCYFCNGCGAGNGFSLLMKFKNWDFKTAAREVDLLLNKGSLKTTIKTGVGSVLRAAFGQEGFEHWQPEPPPSGLHFSRP